ncbi:MAG: hypothetical protein IKY84_00725 [Bacteroidaceae bacterium]|nr:hypothetical protein [Bacteroidaceae bacterium]
MIKLAKCPTHARNLVIKPAIRLLAIRLLAKRHVTKHVIKGLAIKALVTNLATRLLVVRTRLAKNLATTKKSATKPAINSNSYLLLYRNKREVRFSCPLFLFLGIVLSLSTNLR